MVAERGFDADQGPTMPPCATAQLRCHPVSRWDDLHDRPL